MTWLWNLIKDEPVAFAAVIRSAVVMLVLFGLTWTVEQQAAVLLFVETVLAFVTRKSVTPTSKL